MRARRTNALQDLSQYNEPQVEASAEASSRSAGDRMYDTRAHANPKRAGMKRTFEVVARARCAPSLLHEVEGFLDSQDTSQPFQLPQWAGESMFLAMLRSNGRIQWFALCGVTYPASRLLSPIRAFNIHRGPVCDDLDLLETGLRKLIDQAGKMGATYIDIAPEWTGEFAESAARMLGRTGWQKIPGERSSLRLSLSPSLEELLAGFRKTTRYEIRRSMSEGIEVTIAGSEAECRDFIQIYRAMAKEREFPAETPEFLLSIVRWLAEDKSRGGLLLAHEDGKPRGGILVVRSGARCWYILGATSKDGKVGVGHLLQWRAIQWAKENGCLEYDFNGYREGATSGPALFKKGFCDRIVHFISGHRYVVNPVRYRAFEAISRVRRSLRSAQT
jgi:hypothetical protein